MSRERVGSLRRKAPEKWQEPFIDLNRSYAHRREGFLFHLFGSDTKLFLSADHSLHLFLSALHQGIIPLFSPKVLSRLMYISAGRIQASCVCTFWWKGNCYTSAPHFIILPSLFTPADRPSPAFAKLHNGFAYVDIVMSGSHMREEEIWTAAGGFIKEEAYVSGANRVPYTTVHSTVPAHHLPHLPVF